MKTISMKPRQKDEAPVEVTGAQGARRATGAPVTSTGARARHAVGRPDPEVTVKKPRRKFTAKYKLRILDAADACTEPGQMGELLREEGLYSSHLTCWRRQREDGLLKAMEPKKRGRSLKKRNPLAQRVAELESENRRLNEKMRKAEIIIEAQKKISQLFSLTVQDSSEIR